MSRVGPPRADAPRLARERPGAIPSRSPGEAVMILQRTPRAELRPFVERFSAQDPDGHDPDWAQDPDEAIGAAREQVLPTGACTSSSASTRRCASTTAPTIPGAARSGRRWSAARARPPRSATCRAPPARSARAPAGRGGGRARGAGRPPRGAPHDLDDLWRGTGDLHAWLGEAPTARRRGSTARVDLLAARLAARPRRSPRDHLRAGALRLGPRGRARRRAQRLQPAPLHRALPRGGRPLAEGLLPGRAAAGRPRPERPAAGAGPTSPSRPATATSPTSCASSASSPASPPASTGGRRRAPSTTCRSARFRFVQDGAPPKAHARAEPTGRSRHVDPRTLRLPARPRRPAGDRVLRAGLRRHREVPPVRAAAAASATPSSTSTAPR